MSNIESSQENGGSGKVPINNKGGNNPMFGKKHSEETKMKISESRNKYKGENHPMWKGGRRINHNGYVEVRIPNHHRARGNGYVFEHILVAEEKLGRKLKVNEQVHHLNKNRQDNRPENLSILDIAEHTRHHAPERRRGKILNCVVCGKEFYRKASHLNRAKCCSQKCVGHYTYLKIKGELA
jgi:hypothetical protein